MEQPRHARHQQRTRGVGPLSEEAAERLGERGVELGGPCDQPRDGPHGGTCQQARCRRPAPRLPEQRAHPAREHQEVHEQVPQQQAEQRDREDVDAPRAVERG
jgi:hypothetical protein